MAGKRLVCFFRGHKVERDEVLGEFAETILIARFHCSRCGYRFRGMKIIPERKEQS